MSEDERPCLHSWIRIYTSGSFAPETYVCKNCMTKKEIKFDFKLAPAPTKEK